jgi:hypothetical protein
MSTTSFNPQDAEPNELPTTDTWSEAQLATYNQIEADLNAKILAVTMTIRQEFPELSKFIEEMPVTVPDKTNPTITLSNLKGYYESLCGILNRYLEDHGKKGALQGKDICKDTPPAK